MNPLIFREYDIRGIVDKDFNLDDAERIGRGCATYLSAHGAENCAVGRDGRLSSPMISEALIKGLNTGGLNVIDLGVCPTPLLYFAVQHLNLDGGVMITASHNSGEYNGFKICLGSDTLSGEKIQALRTIIESGGYVSGEGWLDSYNILPVYCDDLANNIRLKRPVRLAVDAGNGIGGVAAVPVLKRLNSPPVELFMEPDGNFPNHQPDPSVPRNLKTLSKTVADQGLELGIAFDGDGDRLGVVDESGQIICGDMLMILFAREILKENPGGKFIGEVKCSQIMYDEIKRKGGVPIMWKTGHSLIKNKLKAEKALLAGEMSGHFFFNHRYYGFDDAIYAACRLLEILSGDSKPLSAYLSDLPKTYTTPEIRVDCPDDIKFELVARVKQLLCANYRTIDIDGVRLVFEDGWGLVRASNTSPAIVLRFEAESESRLQEIKDIVEKMINKVTSDSQLRGYKFQREK